MILGELGRGGMGVVYKARQVNLNRICALKMILAGAHAGPEAAARFLSEAETVARLEHPAIVQIHHLGDHDGRPYLELEYVDGGSLDDRSDGTPLPAGEAAELVEALARAIHYSHGLGVVHRDLKPSNILLTHDGRAKIADFGLAKMLDTDSRITGSGLILGTPSYMAPEQASGEAKGAGPSADIYALGAILYALLTGRPPFRAATIPETLRQVREEAPVPPCRLQPSLPRDVETITLKCLQKRPADRYATAAALAEDLRRFRAREPILARPIPAWERGLKWRGAAPGRPGWPRPCVACVLCLLGLGAYSYRRISRSLEAEKLANTKAQEALATAEAETYRALVNDVAALRLGRRSGWRDEAMRDLERAASMDVSRRDSRRPSNRRGPSASARSMSARSPDSSATEGASARSTSAPTARPWRSPTTTATCGSGTSRGRDTSASSTTRASITRSSTARRPHCPPCDSGPAAAWPSAPGAAASRGLTPPDRPRSGRRRPPTPSPAGSPSTLAAGRWRSAGRTGRSRSTTPSPAPPVA